MVAKVSPSKISGIINAPTSKSSMQRACAAALLNTGRTIVHNPGSSNDDLAALEIIKDLGASVKNDDFGNLEILSPAAAASGHTAVEMVPEITLNCGESGLGIRMFTPLAALSNQEITINGTGSLLMRPMDFFDEILPLLGVNIESNKGKLPLKIKGPLVPKNITIDGSLSSQFLTGLLMAYGKAATQPVTITVANLNSKPYIDLTLQVMKDFGYQVVNEHYQSFHISPAAPGNHVVNYTVEGDWSGAAFLLVAGAVGGRLTVTGLDVYSTQADKKILEALRDCGCQLSIKSKEIEVGPPSISGTLKAFHFDATDCPDLFPPLVALAAYCEGTTVIEGVERLAHKESNRALTLRDEFKKMGVAIKLQDNLMLVDGGKGVKGSLVHSRHDHRIAMACAVASLGAAGDTCIEEAEAINKSYPDFYSHLKSLGALVSLS